MPTYASPSLYIDFARLAPPQVIEEIAYEDLLAAYKAGILTRNPDLERALQLEQSATNIILEVEAYGEMLVRARINAAARAVLLPFASGADLDALGALYNEARIPFVENPRSIRTNPEDWDTDARFRRQIQLSVEAFTTAGSRGAYEYHALKADPTIADVSATFVAPGTVKIAVMNSGSDPVPTHAQLEAVTERLYRPEIKPLTDMIRVAPVAVSYTTIDATLTLYPGPNNGLVLTEAGKALTDLRSRVARTGRDLTRSAIITALQREGVHSIDLRAPARDVIVGEDACVWITKADLKTAQNRTE